MFPSRTARAFSALLDVADALLAPVDELAEREQVPAEPLQAHPHRQALTSRRRRRPAPPRQAQPCLSPVARSATAPRAADAPLAASR